MKSTLESFADEESDAVTDRPVTSIVSGCLYAVYVVGLSGVMLFVNALFALSVYSLFPQPDNEHVASRVAQLFYFLVPLLLLIVEWNLLDRVHRLFQSHEQTPELKS